jgi:hypothetical protein
MIEKLRKEIPEIALRTTLITGFPGETEEDHEELMYFVDDMEFDRLGVFTYSPEEDTPAANMPDQIDEELKLDRQAEIMELQQKEGYSPLSGCLPMLIQLPVIMVLYKVIQNPLSYIAHLSDEVIANVATIVSGDASKQIALLNSIITYENPAALEEAGVVFSALACVLYGLLLEAFVDGITVSYVSLGLIGAILSVVSQLGDLIASSIKREYGVKDYGNLFPGHGGVMDRFDSVLAVSTILLIICMAFPPFVIS